MNGATAGLIVNGHRPAGFGNIYRHDQGVFP
jgi:hypothetical protein